VVAGLAEKLEASTAQQAVVQAQQAAAQAYQSVALANVSQALAATRADQAAAIANVTAALAVAEVRLAHPPSLGALTLPWQAQQAAAQAYQSEALANVTAALDRLVAVPQSSACGAYDDPGQCAALSALLRATSW
jgi:hypothetical protein